MCFLSTYCVLGPVLRSGVQSSMCCDRPPDTTAPVFPKWSLHPTEGQKDLSWQLCREAEAGGRKRQARDSQPAPNPSLSDSWEK